MVSIEKTITKQEDSTQVTSKLQLTTTKSQASSDSEVYSVTKQTTQNINELTESTTPSTTPRTTPSTTSSTELSTARSTAPNTTPSSIKVPESQSGGSILSQITKESEVINSTESNTTHTSSNLYLLFDMFLLVFIFV